MDGPQDLLEAFQDAYQVFTWWSPTGVKDLVRDTLRRSPAHRVTPAGPDVIESMMYGGRVAEVMTAILTSDTMQVLCERLQAERDHVAGVYAEAQEVERLRLEAFAAAAAPPRPSAAYPPLAPEPQGPWPPPAGVAEPSQPPPAYRRAHLSPGPGAGRAPSAAVPPFGGAAAAGDPPPPPAKAAGRAATPSPPARFLLGETPDPLYDVWTATGQPPGIPLVPGGSVGREVARGKAASVRACPYPDVRQSPGWATRTPGLALRGHGTAQTGGWGQPQRGWPQRPQGPGQGAGHGHAQARQGPVRTEAAYLNQWAPGRKPPAPPAGGPPAFPAAGAPAHGGPAGGVPAGGAPPAAQAPPVAGGPGDFAGHGVPVRGGAPDRAQQRQLGFEHRPYGRGDPNGNSWPEKVNVWPTHVISSDERERRFHWDARQVVSEWQAPFRVLPRPDPRREDWEREVGYTGGLFRTKRDAKEDACRFFLEEHRRLNRLPDLTTPTPLPGQAARAPGQGVAGQPAPGGGVGQAGRAKPRPWTVAPVAKVQPSPAAPAPGPQHGAPLPSSAAGQDPGADRQPQEDDAGDQGGDRRGAAPSGTGPVGGGPGQDVPGALTERFLLTGAASLAPPSPLTPSPWEQPPSPPRPPGDFCVSDSHTPTEVEDDEGARVASESLAEQEAEARAALAAEGLAEAAQVPVPEEAGSGMASGGSAGSLGWLGGPDPDPGQDTSDRFPVSPDKRPPVPATPEEQYKGVKQEPKEGA